MEHEKSIKQIINDSLDQIRSVIDADTVVGKEIETISGTVIIPISKVSIGTVTGGLDLPRRQNNRFKDFGGGGGTGVTVTPMGFLVVYANGHTEMLNMAPSGDLSLMEQINEVLTNAPIIVDKVKSVLDDTPFGAPVYKNEAEEKRALIARKKRIAKQQREREKARRRKNR